MREGNGGRKKIEWVSKRELEIRGHRMRPSLKYRLYVLKYASGDVRLVESAPICGFEVRRWPCVNGNASIRTTSNV